MRRKHSTLHAVRQAWRCGADGGAGYGGDVEKSERVALIPARCTANPACEGK